MGDAKYGQYGSDSDALPQAYQPANANQYVPPASGFQGTILPQIVIVDVQISFAGRRDQDFRVRCEESALGGS